MSYIRPTAAVAAQSTAPLVPPACYRVLAVKVEAATSKASGAAMVKIGCQILSPDSVKNANGTVSQTAGVEGDMYIVFSDKNMANAVKALELLGVPLPPQATSQDEDVAAMQSAAVQYLEAMTFEMAISSKKEQMKGPDGQPITDSLGRPIQGFERADFNTFNLVGLPKKLSEVGGGARPF